MLSLHLWWIVASLAFLFSPCLTKDFSCGPNKPCKVGCCGINNVCGLGPAYCSTANCTSSCGEKSECDPGWGPQWSSREKCPLNVCCSKFGTTYFQSRALRCSAHKCTGFCGTTAEFCGTQQVTSPSCSGTSSNQRTIGYYEGWSITRNCDR